jgi:hypothetical protein
MEVKNEKTRDLAEKVMGYEVIRNGHTVNRTQVEWNPFTSRDDAHELLGRLTDEQWSAFTRHLVSGTSDLPDFAIEAMFRAGFSSTPAQISEAVWRATCQ